MPPTDEPGTADSSHRSKRLSSVESRYFVARVPLVCCLLVDERANKLHGSNLKASMYQTDQDRPMRLDHCMSAVLPTASSGTIIRRVAKCQQQTHAAQQTNFIIRSPGQLGQASKLGS
jgi:hypothetical protein